MTIELIPILIILFTHWVADFVAQSNWMAQNKSKSHYALYSHVLTYTLILFIGSLFISTNDIVLFYCWAIFNGLVHYGVDYITSRVSSKLYSEGKIHDFFVVIGFDQFLHAATLLLSYYYITLH